MDLVLVVTIATILLAVVVRAVAKDGDDDVPPEWDDWSDD